MASISELGNMTDNTPIDLGSLQRERRPRFPQSGIYTLRVPDQLDPDFTFGETKAGNLSVEISPTIVGGDHDGYEVRYQKLSAKVFPEKVRDKDGNETGTRNTSQVARFLAACGIKGTLASDDDIRQAVLATAGKEFRAVLDWRAYNKRTETETVGMENFPKSERGNPVPFIDDPEDTFVDEATGVETTRRYPARIFVKRYFPR